MIIFNLFFLKVEQNDRANLYPEDFTVRVDNLPPPDEGEHIDMLRLEDALALHFERICNEVDPIIPGRCRREKVNVIDVNFGLKNKSTIKLMRKRGVLCRLLDLETEKLNLMRLRGASRAFQAGVKDPDLLLDMQVCWGWYKA